MGKRSEVRRLALLLAVGSGAVYLALQWQDGTASASVVQPVRAAARPAARAGTPAPAPLLTPPVRAAIAPQPQGALFAATSWLPPPPPPPPPKVVAAPPPQAPPLPFRFVGLIENSARPTAFLSRGDALLIVSAGQTLDGGYRVDTISPSEIVLTYLPMNQKQLIRIAGDM